LFFFDDILIYSQTWEEHLQHLATVFKILWANRLYVEKEKSNFGQKRISYLGHIIDQERVSMDLKKITAMLNWPKPNTLKMLKGFLGLTSYYRKFIQHYGSIARPLTQLLKKDAFKWDGDADKAFQQLQLAMTRASILSSLDFSKTFVIECDASRMGIGEVLMQKKKD